MIGKPKKSLGQHWLTNKYYLEKMTQAADLKTGEVILEIGPGQGILTEALLTQGAQVIAVEKDKGLIFNLNEKFKSAIDQGQLKLIEADILKFKPEEQIKENYKIIANIPYYITGKILD